MNRGVHCGKHGALTLTSRSYVKWQKLGGSQKMYYVGVWSVSFSNLYIPRQRFVNLSDLSIPVFCEMAKAWWPLASAVMVLWWGRGTDDKWFCPAVCEPRSALWRTQR